MIMQKKSLGAHWKADIKMIAQEQSLAERTEILTAPEKVQHILEGGKGPNTQEPRPQTTADQGIAAPATSEPETPIELASGTRDAVRSTITSDGQGPDSDATDEEPLLANDAPPPPPMRTPNECNTRTITVPEHAWFSLLTSVKDLLETVTKLTGSVKDLKTQNDVLSQQVRGLSSPPIQHTPRR